MDHQQQKFHSSSTSSTSVRTLVRSSSKVISISSHDSNNSISNSSSRTTTTMTNNNSNKNKKNINRSRSLIIIKGSPRNQQYEYDDDNDDSNYLHTTMKTNSNNATTPSKQRNNNHHTKKLVSTFDDFESLIVQSTIADIERMNKNRLCKMILLVCMCLLITVIGQLTSVNTYTTIFRNSDNDNNNQKEEEKQQRLNGAGTHSSAIKMMSITSSSPQRNTNHEPPNIHPNNKKKMNNGMTIPTLTTGVILHLGRTGGTLIAQQLLLNNSNNDVSSMNNNMNQQIQKYQSSNATTLSQLTTYYHHSEFNALSLADNYDINEGNESNLKTNNLRSNTNKNTKIIPLSYHQRRPPKNVVIVEKNSNSLSSTNISSSKYQFVILTLRDPFDRTISSYAWMHPSNPNYTIPNTSIIAKPKLSTEDNVHHSSSISSAQVRERHDTFYNVCFPDLNTFAAALTAVDDVDASYKSDEKRDNDVDNSVTPSEYCRELAQSVLNNQVQELEYFFWDTKHVWNHFLDDTENSTTTDTNSRDTSFTKNSSLATSTQQTPSTKKLIDANADIYVIRLESMNEDWQTIHTMLGLPVASSSSQTVQTDTVIKKETSDSTISSQSESSSSLFNDVVVVHDSNNEHIIDPSLISINNNKNHEQLCNALLSEYVAYLSLLKRATNIQQSQQEQSLYLAQQRCPNLNLQY